MMQSREACGVEVWVLTAQEDGMRQRPDSEVLERATELGRVAVSEDADFLAEAARRQNVGEHFGGVIRLPQSLPIGVCVDNLELIAHVNTPEDHVGRVVYLPL